MSRVGAFSSLLPHEVRHSSGKRRVACMRAARRLFPPAQPDAGAHVSSAATRGASRRAQAQLCCTACIAPAPTNATSRVGLLTRLSAPWRHTTAAANRHRVSRSLALHTRKLAALRRLTFQLLPSRVSVAPCNCRASARVPPRHTRQEGACVLDDGVACMTVSSGCAAWAPADAEQLRRCAVDFMFI